MKFLLAVAVLAAAVAAKDLPTSTQRDPDATAFGYLTKYGVAAAEARRKAEEKIVSSRIYGGEVSEEGQWPYQVGILIDLATGQTALCGGCLLSRRRAATAAHCWWDGVTNARQFTVVLGSALLYFGGTRIATSEVYVHGDWTPWLVMNDIAMIHFPAVTVSDTIAPIRLPTGTELTQSFSNLAATASGYGFTDSSNSITFNQALSHVHLLILDNVQCTQGFPAAYVRDTNICTSGAFGNNVCPGDSGGPIAINRNNTMVLVGIFSYGSTLGCTAGMPAIHSRVTSYMDFFQEHLN